MLLLAGAACEDASPTGAPLDEGVAAIQVGPLAARGGKTAVAGVTPSSGSIQPGETLQLVAVGTSGGEVSAQWSSSAPAVASVSSSGLVTGVAPGTATIRADRRGGSATAEITVAAGGGEPVETAPAPAPAPEEPTPTPAAGPSQGIWIGAAELAALPTSGAAWTGLKAAADASCGTPVLSDQESTANVCVMAKALVFARTGTSSYRTDVVAALRAVAGSGTYSGRALALGRELGAYVIAADLVGLAQHDPALDGQFRTKIRELLTTRTTDGPTSLVDCHEKRPNNWGNHCGASRIAVAIYLGDGAELQRAATVFRGYLGDRAAYAGFRYGSDLTWQCDPTRPVGINPRGCSRDGRSLDGVLPDDQRRGGSFSWPPPRENYVYEGLQGALAQALMLHRRGYDAWNWSDRALLRAFQWLHTQASFPATGDDGWQPHVVNRFYGTSFPATDGTRPGKNVGWTDWTLQ